MSQGAHTRREIGVLLGGKPAGKRDDEEYARLRAEYALEFGFKPPFWQRVRSCMTAKGLTAADGGIVGKAGEPLVWDDAA